MAYSSEGLKKLAFQLIKEAEQNGVTLRLLGGLAFYLTSPRAASLKPLQRNYQDLDFAVDRRGARVLPDVFSSRGWEADRHFNALHGNARLLFYYQEKIQADVFVGVFEQCHKLFLEDRLKFHAVTLPLADLLLTKLQIHQLNLKDLKDIFMFLLAHEPAVKPAGKNGIDLSYLLKLTSDDWGWYTTVHDNLVALERKIPKDLQAGERTLIKSRLKSLKEAMQAAPKTLRWQLRAQIGRRVPWYDEPEEVKR